MHCPVCSTKSTTLQNYVLLRALGKGSFGAVFLAAPIDKPNDKQAFVAIKRFLSSSDTGLAATELKKLARQEIAFATQLIASRQPHLVSVLHLVADPGSARFFETNAIVFEYCTEGTLDKFIQKRQESKKPLKPAELVSLASQLLSGLCLLHEKQLVHRDIAPRNILITRDAANELVFKVADYGRCGWASSNRDDLGQGNASPHAAPERNLTFRSDVFGVGAILYEAATTKLLPDIPDVDDSLVDVELEKSREEVRLGAQGLRPAYGDEIVNTLLKLLAETEGQRLNASTALTQFNAFDLTGTC